MLVCESSFARRAVLGLFRAVRVSRRVVHNARHEIARTMLWSRGLSKRRRLRLCATHSLLSLLLVLLLAQTSGAAFTADLFDFVPHTVTVSTASFASSLFDPDRK